MNSARVVAFVVGLMVVGLAAAAGPWAWGYALYHGYLQLKGRIAGHENDLPVNASRCSNCHDAANNSGKTTRSIAPVNETALTTPVQRRGGPPSVYSESSFCSFLGDGIDPAFIQSDRTMPRFNLSSLECHALWTYVSMR